MRVLFGCERSGIGAAAFNARGHDAWSCDLVPTTHPFHRKHLQCDVFEAMAEQWGGNAHQRRVHRRFVQRFVDHTLKASA